MRGFGIHVKIARHADFLQRLIVLDEPPPPPNADVQEPKTCISLGKFDPLRQFYWRAEGGAGMGKCLTFVLFWPSANRLAWRKGLESIGSD